MLAYQLEDQPTRYSLTAYDRDGAAAGAASTAAPDARGHACAPLVLAPGRDGYTIVRVDTERPEFSGTTDVHVARDPATDQPRIIGIWRR